MISDHTPVFEATSLTKKFGDTIALNSVTLSLGAHRVIGLIGRNGGVKADKSLDDLHQTYAKWTVTGSNLPQRFSEPYILPQTVNGMQAHLIVNQALGNADQFKRYYATQDLV